MIEQIARALYAAMYPLDEDEIDETDTLDLSWTALVPIAETAILPLIEAAVLAERERCARVAEWRNPSSAEYQRGRSDAAKAIREVQP